MHRESVPFVLPGEGVEFISQFRIILGKNLNILLIAYRNRMIWITTFKEVKWYELASCREEKTLFQITTEL